jgi:hypothetical protein
MEQQPPPVSAITTLPGIVDLPLQAKYHFAKVLLAEQEGEYLLAEFELHRAVAADEALSKREPAA